MRLFRRAPRSRFPDDMAAWLEVFGRHRLDPMTSRIDGADLWQRLVPLLEDAKTDQDGFLADLAAVVAGDQGGFAALGAAGVVWEIFDRDALRIPAALRLIDAGIAVKTARALPSAAFTGYEWERVLKLRDAG